MILYVESKKISLILDKKPQSPLPNDEPQEDPVIIELDRVAPFIADSRMLFSLQSTKIRPIMLYQFPPMQYLYLHRLISCKTSPRQLRLAQSDLLTNSPMSSPKLFHRPHWRLYWPPRSRMRLYNSNLTTIHLRLPNLSTFKRGTTQSVMDRKGPEFKILSNHIQQWAEFFDKRHT